MQKNVTYFEKWSEVISAMFSDIKIRYPHEKPIRKVQRLMYFLLNILGSRSTALLLVPAKPGTS